MNQGAQRAFISYIFSLILTQSATGATQRLATKARSACGAVRAAQRFAMPRAAFKLPTVAANSSRALSVLQQHGQTHQQYRGVHYAAVAAGLALAGWSQHQTAHAEVRDRVGLVGAARSGNLDEVKRLLAQGADINAVDSCGDTALYDAIQWRPYDVVAFFLASGARLEAGRREIPARLLRNTVYADQLAAALKRCSTMPEGIRPKALRAVQSDAPIGLIQQLIEQGVNLNSTVCSQGEQLRCGTLLTHAVWSGNRDIALCLIEVGADLNPVAGTSPLTAAAENGDIPLMELLITAGAAVNPAVLSAACAKNSETTRFLLTNRTVSEIEHGSSRCPVLFEALERGDTELVRLLLRRGAKLNGKWYGKRPLAVAASRGDTALVQLLLKQPWVRVGYDECATAIESGAEEVLRLILIRCSRATLEPGGRMPLLLKAVSRKNIVMASLLLLNGADPNRQWHGERPLDVAVSQGDTALVQLLLNQPRIHVTYNACKAAILANHTESLRLLLRHGTLASIESGKKPLLHYAMFREHASVLAQLLIEQGASVKTQFNGQTALHLACERGKKEYAQLLLDAGADVEARNAEGRTALHVAAVSCKPELVQLLLQAGALTKATDQDEKRAVELCGQCDKTKAGRIRSALITHWMATRNAAVKPVDSEESSAQAPKAVTQSEGLTTDQSESERADTLLSPCQECSAIVQVTQWLGQRCSAQR